MGHIVNPDRSYHLLQQRLDRNVTGAPETPAFMQILKLLFSPTDAEIARQLPTNFTGLTDLSRKLHLPEAELLDILSGMAERGCVIDIERHGQRYFSLAPVVIGFFEFTFMRLRPDAPLPELARLFDAYFKEDDRFARAIFQHETQIGRSLVREEALPADVSGQHVEILDWERASTIVKTATDAAVSLCACRHHASHLNEGCGRPQRTCLSFNYGAKTLVRNGVAERITNSEAMDILELAKVNGLAQTADNVQRNVGYICNCCGDCCGMMNAIRRFDLRGAIVTSNWISDIDLSHCNGCGRCAKVCPVNAITIEEQQLTNRRKRWAVRNADLCLGCGVCYSACRHGALSMNPRPRRVFTPESTFDRMVAMAIERGKLADLILDNTEGLGYQAVGRIIQVLEKSPPYKAALAIKPLRSIFLDTVVRGIKLAAGPASADVQ
ncbi:MAG: 4Fe-4S binding protein [Anaerolineae bacterium]